MTTGLNALIPTLFLVVLLLSSGVRATRADASQASAGGGVDVCAALPREEAMKILGSKMLRARPANLGAANECHYTDGISGTITVLVETGISRKAFDEEMKLFGEHGVKLVPAGGVGDSGHFYDTRLYAYAGKYRVVITTGDTPGMDEAKARANAVALA